MKAKITIPLSSLELEKLASIFQKTDAKKPYTFLDAVAREGCFASIARPK